MIKVGWRYALFERQNDMYIVQLKSPFFSILHTYFSDDAGMYLSYIRYAVPKKHIQERPL